MRKVNIIQLSQETKTVQISKKCKVYNKNPCNIAGFKTVIKLKIAIIISLF